MRKIIIYVAMFLATINVFAQTNNAESIITTAVPFLTIAPDPRGGAMGDLGVATSADISSLYYNAAKYSFMEKISGVQANYSPWLPKIANDMALHYLSGYYKINEKQAFAFSMKYFQIGEIQFTNEYGEYITASKPNEFALTGGYSMLLTDNFSGAISMRFIYSNLTGGVSGASSQLTHAGIAVAGDLAFFYNKPLTIGGKDAVARWGINFQNLGTKISYGTSLRPFIPTNLKTGAGLEYTIDDFNSIAVNLELNKLMVPTPDSTGPHFDMSVTEGIFTSFADAPGGFKEELHEITESFGLEYAYNQMFFIRSGVFYENANKGGRQFLTLGIGFKFSVFELNYSYLVPLYRDNALANTMRFSFGFYFNQNK